MEAGEGVISGGGRVTAKEVGSKTEPAEEGLHVLAYVKLTEVRAEGNKGEALAKDRAFGLREGKVRGDSKDPAGLGARDRGGGRWEACGVSREGLEVGVRRPGNRARKPGLRVSRWLRVGGGGKDSGRSWFGPRMPSP